MSEAHELPGVRQRAAMIRQLERAIGEVASAALVRMDETLPWFRTIPAETRAWIGMVAQAGVAAFIDWYRRPDDAEIPREVFGVAPRELARAVTLRQSLDMVRVTVDVLEEKIANLASTGEEGELHAAAIRFSREIAFAAAQVYAAAAEQRGAWDARLEALVVDALVRDEVDDALTSRAAALGWASPPNIVVLTGLRHAGEPQSVVTSIHRAARKAGVDVLAGVQGERLVVVLGGSANGDELAAAVVDEFADGPVVVGPTVHELGTAGRSARASLAGHAAVTGWAAAPRLLPASDLLPERVLNGDPEAHEELIKQIRPLGAAGGGLLETLEAYLACGGSLEATARALYVHANTVRYRLRRVAELTGYTAATPRDAFTLQVALSLGRLTNG